LILLADSQLRVGARKYDDGITDDGSSRRSHLDRERLAVPLAIT
jgi:hypothetical protein